MDAADVLKDRQFLQNLLQGGSASVGGTPLGTPPGEGFHAARMQRPNSAQGTQHASQPQQGPHGGSSYSFLSQVRHMFDWSQQRLLRECAASFSAAHRKHLLFCLSMLLLLVFFSDTLQSCLQGQQQQQSLLHQRSSSFSGTSGGGLPPHPDFSSTRSHSAGMPCRIWGFRVVRTHEGMRPCACFVMRFTQLVLSP